MLKDKRSTKEECSPEMQEEKKKYQEEWNGRQCAAEKPNQVGSEKSPLDLEVCG